MKHTTPTLGALLESFFHRRLIAQRRASRATVATYRDALKLFLLFASKRCGRPPSRLTVADLDRDSVLAFLDHIEKNRGNSVRTRNARLTAIRSFFQHVAYTDPTSLGIAQRVLSIPGKRTITPLMSHLDSTELRALLGAPNRHTRLGRRDYILLLFLADTGARVSEAVGIDVADIQFEAPSYVVLHGKGSKDRMVPLRKEVAKLLKGICEEPALRSDEHLPVFVNRRGERLTRFGVTHVLRRAVAVARRSQPTLASRAVSPHTLRHTAAMRLLQSGVDLSVIRSWLGHVSLNTTHHYIEADVEMKRRALARCDVTLAKAMPYRPSDSVLSILESL